MTNNAGYTDPETYRNEASREAIIENIDICVTKTFCVVQDRCKGVHTCLTKMLKVHAGSPIAVLFKFAWAVNCCECHFVWRPLHRTLYLLLRILSLSHGRTHTHTHTHSWKTTVTIICPAFSLTLRGALADNKQTSCLYKWRIKSD